MADTLNPQELERYRQQALEFANRAQQFTETPSLSRPPLSYDQNSQGDTVQPGINPPSTATSYEQFLAEHPAEGSLKVQLTAGAFPVSGATVEVVLHLNGDKYVIYRNETNESGISDNMVLPAQPFLFSQDEATASGSGTPYKVNIFHPSFEAINDETVTIFDSVKTILPITLRPSVSPERSGL